MGVARGFSRYLKFVLAALFVAAGFILPSAASATVFSAQAADPGGDGPSPGRDLTETSVRYDNTNGRIEFVVKLAEAPTGDPQVTTAVGRMANGSCSVPLLILGTFLPSGPSLWLVERDGNTPAEEQGEATRELSGSTIKLSAEDSRLAGFEPDCAEAILSDPDDTTVIYDRVETYAVKPPPPKPNLKTKVSRVGNLKRGASKVVKVTVSNSGSAAARKVVLRARVRGAATLKPRVRKLGGIPAGKSRTARFRVRVKPRGKGKVTIFARATGRKVKSSASTSFRVAVPQPPPPPSGGLAGKIFWGFESYQWDRSAETVFLHFTNRNFVRFGVPKGGLANCRKVTARVKDGEMQPGCLRYSFDSRTGKVRIGKVRGTFRGGELKLNMKDDIWPNDGDVWYTGLVAKPGSTYRAKLINRGYDGACGITPYCTTWAEYLQLTPNGAFGRQDSSMTTGGTPGVNFIAISKLGPNEKGRYRVLSGGRIRFSYASGKTVTETLILQTDKRGRPNVARKGILLNDVWFYKDDD